MNKLPKLLMPIVIFLVVISIFFLTRSVKIAAPDRYEPVWQIRSIDTVKYSRDLSREKMKDPSFDLVIEGQIKNIKETGVTHVAISTPYDDEFKPFLLRWINSARQNGLKVWFRGNFSGWEKWFNYEGIDRQTHLSKTETFILENPDIFEDGDIFTSCPECENGGPGDPRSKGDVDQFRSFLIDEYNISQYSFQKIGKNVQPGYFSMNYDVAKLVMDPQTTQNLGGIVAIDHYVATPGKLSSDIEIIAQSSQGKIVLGEFGAPINDITGKMTEDEQAKWIDDVLGEVSGNRDLIGLNYWVNVGGSTQIWNDKGTPTKSVDIITKYFKLTRKSL